MGIIRGGGMLEPNESPKEWKNKSPIAIRSRRSGTWKRVLGIHGGSIPRTYLKYGLQMAEKNSVRRWLLN